MDIEEVIAGALAVIAAIVLVAVGFAWGVGSVTHSCRNLNSFESGGKVYTCEEVRHSMEKPR